MKKLRDEAAVFAAPSFFLLRQKKGMVFMKNIFLDIDGTLFDHSTLCIPPSAYRAVELAKDAGHRVFICTGRSCCMLDQVEAIPYEGVVAAAGAYVEAQGKVLFEECIDAAELQRVLAHCRDLGVSYILEGNRGVYMHSVIREYFETGAGRKESGHDFFRQKKIYGMEAYAAETEKIYKFCIYVPKLETIGRLREKFTDKYHFVCGTADRNNLIYTEVTLKKNNKASGIQKVLEYYGADMADTVAVGDSLNDLEMLETCGTGIAMGNADEQLKKYADYVTDSIDKDGLYKAFAHYGLLEQA